MSHHAKFVKDIGLVGVAQAFSNLRGLILIPVLTKFLGAEQYGIWAQFFVTLNFIVPITLLSLSNSLIRFLPGSEDKKEIQEQVWSTNLLVAGITFFVAAILTLFAKQISNILQIPPHLIFLLGILVILQSLGFLLSSVLQALQEAKKLSFFIVGVPLVEVIFASLAVLFGFKLEGAVLGLVLARSLSFFVLFVVILKKVGLKFPDFSRIKEHFQFGLPIVISNLAYRVVQVGDHYLISIMLGILFVGYYAPAYSFGFMLNMVTLPVGMILPAVLAKFFAEQKIEEIKQYLAQTFKYTFFILIPAVFGLGTLSKQLLTIFSTEDIAIHSYKVLPIIATSFLFFASYGIFAQILYLFKKTMMTGILWVGAAILNIVLNVFFIPTFGIVGAAFATLFSYGALCIATWIWSWRYLSFSLPWQALGKSLIASILMSAMIATIHPEGIVAVLFTIAIAMLLYGIFLIFLKAIGRKEIEFFSLLLKGTKHPLL